MAKNEQGFTLVELMMTMFLIGIAIAVLLSLVNAATGIMRDIQVRSTADSEAQTVASSLAWEIRSAVPLVEGDPVIAIANGNEVMFYRVGSAGAVPVRYHYVLTAPKLTKYYQTAAAGGPPWDFPGVDHVAEVGAIVRNSAAIPMFRYYDDNGTEIVPETAQERASIRMIRINIRSDVDPLKAPAAANVTQEVYLRNQR